MKHNSWMIYIIIFFLVLVIMNLIGNKSVHHEIQINANPEKVWEVLTDTDKYKEWNPVMELLEGTIKEGNQVKYRFTQDEHTISEIPAKVKKIITSKLLNQGGGLPFVLRFDHKYILEQKGKGTLLTIQEEYKGIYVNFWNPKPVELAYQRLNKAIKKRAENNTK